MIMPWDIDCINQNYNRWFVYVDLFARFGFIFQLPETCKIYQKQRGNQKVRDAKYLVRSFRFFEMDFWFLCFNLFHIFEFILNGGF